MPPESTGTSIGVAIAREGWSHSTTALTSSEPRPFNAPAPLPPPPLRPPLLLFLSPAFFSPQEVPEFTLRSVEVVVFDEADRLFEMGFAEQLREIMRGVPEERQSLLFSATMPKQLVQFARAGLKDPVLIRLDTESKISTELRCARVGGRGRCWVPFFGVGATHGSALLFSKRPGVFRGIA